MTNVLAHPAARGGPRRLRAAPPASGAPATAPIPVPLGRGAMKGSAPTDAIVRSACSPELLAATEAAVDGALDAIFIPDPLLGPGLSQFASVLASIVKRHGLLLETAAAEALERSGRYLVLRNLAMPITEPTQELLRDSTPDLLRGRSIALAGSVAQTVFLDLVAIDTKERRAIIAEIKRGSGKSERRKIDQVEWILRAAQLQGRSFAASLGFQVSSARAVLIDVYGRAGFSEDLTVAGADLDTLFGVPVADALATVTAVLAARLRAVLPDLVEAAYVTAGGADGSHRLPGC